jgi:hypothetical protein
MCCRRHSADVVCPNLFFARARAGKRKKYITKSIPGAVGEAAQISSEMSDYFVARLWWMGFKQPATVSIKGLASSDF